MSSWHGLFHITNCCIEYMCVNLLYYYSMASQQAVTHLPAVVRGPWPYTHALLQDIFPDNIHRDGDDKCPLCFNPVKKLKKHLYRVHKLGACHCGKVIIRGEDCFRCFCIRGNWRECMVCYCMVQGDEKCACV